MSEKRLIKTTSITNGVELHVTKLLQNFNQREGVKVQRKHTALILKLGGRGNKDEGGCDWEEGAEWS